ncbi:Fe-S oxidoreductase (plasmid) [Ensifer sp. WSM1721]
MFVHCTERTNAETSIDLWKFVFKSLGMDLAIADTGCCGMAGTFGHQARNRALSEKLYAMSWKPVIDTSQRTDILMATGYSCRSQAKTIDGRILPHPILVIEQLIARRAK